MTQASTRLVLGFFLLVVTRGPGMNCYAMPQEQAAEVSPETKTIEPAKSRKEKKVEDPTTNFADYDNSVGMTFLKHLEQDQKAMWTSPFHLRPIDAEWLVPMGIATGSMLATDTERSKHLSNSPSRLSNSNTFSNYGIASMAAVGGGLYIWGQLAHNDHQRETGFLAGESALDSLAIVYGLKYAFGRERPLQDNYQGNFWRGGDSFPSEHAAAAWSIASVIAHEYPGPLTTLLAYGMASAISASRITAKQHFPTDVFVGSAIGWFVGQYVYRTHHDPELPGAIWPTWKESHDEGAGRKFTSVGSPFVPLDSWIYPTIEQLAAMGYIQKAFLGMRPWTRIECARLVEEAGDRTMESGSDVYRTYNSLRTEFQGEIAELGGVEREKASGRVESIYSRFMDIDGPPMHDSYHFGQTIINDGGRPFAEGFNSIQGFSGWGVMDRFTIYVSGEYQHAPSSPSYSSAVTSTLSGIDSAPVSGTFPSVDQFRLLDTYVAANVADWNLSFGKQSMWWSPDRGSAFLISNNAEPMYMFRASRITPFTLPWIFKYLGPMKVDVFYGKLSGNENPARPELHGEKISFKPIPDLELGWSRTVELAGVGRATTPGHIWLSYTSLTSPNIETPNTDPGKRTGGFDFSYRVPFLNHFVTVYTDSIADDDPSPLANPPRAGFNPGFYIPRMPKLQKLDLRVEAVYTNVPTIHPNENFVNGGHYIYWDSFYRNLYLNKTNLIGSWIGRDGTGYQAWSTYHFSAKNNIEFAYRHAKVDKTFIPQGETVNDGSVSVNWWFRNDFCVSGFVQYEKWLAPILASGPQANVTTSLALTFWPQTWRR
jgi:membrane-associated phospholipid phosphatase